MRRYILYMAVALVAFAVGSFIFIKFSFKVVERSAIAQTSGLKTPADKEITLKSTTETLEKDDSDPEEKAAFEVLKPTIRKWLRGQKIKNEFTEASDESIKKISGKNKSELSEDEKRWFSYFLFEPTLIDADGDGKKELAIRNNCAPVGNCQFWIFKKNGGDYQIILKTSAGAVQTFEFKALKTNGYFDLETKDHGTASSGGINIYKFDGEKYKVRECFDYDYSFLKDGKLYELKTPRITPVNCSE